MPGSGRRRVRTRAGAVGLITAAAIVLFAVPAFAHITVTPGSAVAGSASELTFRVPDEEAKADTVKVDVQIPAGHPIAQLLVKPIPGWSIEVKSVTLTKPLVTDDGSFSQAVSEVIWSGGQIAPGQFQDFSVSADPLPQGVSQLVFKTIQTYSNGDVVRWIDVSQPGQPAPDHPAPVLTLITGQAAPVSAAAAGPGSGSASGSGSGSGSGSSTLALVAGIAGLVCGLTALVLTWRRGMQVSAGPYPGAGEPPIPAPAARTAQGPAARAPGTSGRRQPGSRRSSARR